MPSKGMRSIFFKASSPSPSTTTATAPSTPERHSFSESMMLENIDSAETLITKWDADASTFASVTSLFHDNRREAMDFLKAVKDLHSSMHFFVRHDSGADKLLRAQILMQTAMKRLQKEFYQILASNRDCLDPESVSTRSSRTSARSSTSDFDYDTTSDDEIRVVTDSISEVERVSSLATADLKAIADCMISTGYGKECVTIYKSIRKSIIDEGLYHLGIERLSPSQLNKIDWDMVDLKIRYWLSGVKTAVTTLFYGERILCDHVFSSSDTIRESCFTDITRDGAMYLFEFPEFIAKFKKSPEKMFRTLDVYEALADLWPEIEFIFCFESTSTVRSQAITALTRLSESVRTMLTDFEAAIQKDTSKSPVPGGGVHPLTRYVMNYLALLSDSSGVLSDIVADWPLKVQSPLPESYFESLSSDSGAPAPAISLRLGWLVLVLLCKLDGKAELYKDVALSYIFLANNLQYVINKVVSSNLRYLLGEDWISKHEAKLKQYAANYERMGWSKVFDALPANPAADIPPEEVKQRFKRFDTAFEEAYRKQTSWVVADAKLRDEIKVSLAKKLGSIYLEFYEKNRPIFGSEMRSNSLVRFSPDDLGNYVSDLFHGVGVSSSGSSTPSSSSPSPSSSPARLSPARFARRFR